MTDIYIRVQWRVVAVKRSFSFDGYENFFFIWISLLGDDTAFVSIYFVDAILVGFCQASVANVHSFFSRFEISSLCVFLCKTYFILVFFLSCSPYSAIFVYVQCNNIIMIIPTLIMLLANIKNTIKKTLFVPSKFSISIVFLSSWDLNDPKRNWTILRYF